MQDWSGSDDPLMWLREAECAGADLDLFFVKAGRSISSEARQMCARCPVAKQCLERAYQRDFSAGYFGGMSPGERKNTPLEKALERIHR